jgi:hypothetical protein
LQNRTLHDQILSHQGLNRNPETVPEMAAAIVDKLKEHSNGSNSQSIRMRE